MPERVAILIPVFNDWESLDTLLAALDTSLTEHSLRGLITIVDDGSTRVGHVGGPDGPRYQSLDRIELVRLRVNLGHQRAIAIGLAHLSRHVADTDLVVVMDGDGEDSPADVPVLVGEWHRQRTHIDVLFAARRKRLESPLFRLLYQVYRFVHWILTGVPVRVGNFSVVSGSALPRLLAAPEIWNHYAASVFRSRLPFSTVPIARARRYHGRSRMSYSSLVVHGLSAIAVFGDIVGARLLMFFSSVLALSVAALAVVLFIRFGTDYAIPGWATTAAGLLALVSLQAITSIVVLALLVLSDRSALKVIALRDADWYIQSATKVVGR